MGGKTSKEEIVIAQNSGAGQNTANATQTQHEQTNIILIIILAILVLGILLASYKFLKRCQDKQIQRRLDDNKLMRYASILRRHRIETENV